MQNLGFFTVEKYSWCHGDARHVVIEHKIGLTLEEFTLAMQKNGRLEPFEDRICTEPVR